MSSILRGCPSGLVLSQTLPLKACQIDNKIYQVLDRDLEACSDVDRLAFVVLFRSEDDCFSGVLHVEELTCGFARSPNFNVRSQRTTFYGRRDEGRSSRTIKEKEICRNASIPFEVSLADPLVDLQLLSIDYKLGFLVEQEIFNNSIIISL